MSAAPIFPSCHSSTVTIPRQTCRVGGLQQPAGSMAPISGTRIGTEGTSMSRHGGVFTEPGARVDRTRCRLPERHAGQTPSWHEGFRPTQWPPTPPVDTGIVEGSRSHRLIVELGCPCQLLGDRGHKPTAAGVLSGAGSPVCFLTARQFARTCINTPLKAVHHDYAIRLVRRAGQLR
jgi:hypothetical protein